MSRAQLSLAALFLVSACATTPQWSHPTKPMSALAADEEACRIEGEVRVTRHEAPPKKVQLEGLANIFSILGEKGRDSQYQSDLREFINGCLQQKGWMIKP